LKLPWATVPTAHRSSPMTVVGDGAEGPRARTGLEARHDTGACRSGSRAIPEEGFELAPASDGRTCTTAELRNGDLVVARSVGLRSGPEAAAEHPDASQLRMTI
jgi:hypothetical protein